MRKSIIFSLIGIILVGALYTVTYVNQETVFKMLAQKIQDDKKPKTKTILTHSKDGFMETDGEYNYYYAFVEEKIWIAGTAGGGGNFPLAYILSKFKPTGIEQELAYEMLEIYHKVASEQYKKFPLPIDEGLLAAIHRRESTYTTYVSGRYKQAQNGVSAEQMTLANFSKVEHDKVGRCAYDTLYKNKQDDIFDGPTQIEYGRNAMNASPKYSSDIRAPSHNGDNTFDIFYFPDTLTYLGIATAEKWIDSDLTVMTPNGRRAVMAMCHNRGSVYQQFQGIPYNPNGDVKGKLSSRKNTYDVGLQAIDLDRMLAGAVEKYNIKLEEDEGDAGLITFILLKEGWFFDNKSLVLASTSRLNRTASKKYFDQIFPEAVGSIPSEFIANNYIKPLTEASGYTSDELSKIYGYTGNYSENYSDFPFMYYVSDKTTSNYKNKDSSGNDPKIIQAWDLVGLEYISTNYFKSDFALLKRLIDAGCPAEIDGVAINLDNLAQIKTLGGGATKFGTDGYYITKKVKKLIRKEPVQKQQNKTKSANSTTAASLLDTGTDAENFKKLLTYIDNPPKGETMMSLYRSYLLSGAPYVQMSETAGIPISLETVDEIMNTMSAYKKDRNSVILKKKDGTPYTEGTTNEELMYYGRRIADCVALLHMVRNHGYCNDTRPYINGYNYSYGTVKQWQTTGEGNIHEYKTIKPDGTEIDSSVYIIRSKQPTKYNDEILRPGDLYVFNGHGYIIFGKANQSKVIPISETRTDHTITISPGVLISLESGNGDYSGIEIPGKASALVIARPLYSDYIKEVYSGSLEGRVLQ